jgi:putative oxidoreductase
MGWELTMAIGTATAPVIPSKPRLIGTWILRILLGVLFLAVGVEKLTGTQGTIPFFAAIGWGQWFRYASGVLDAGGALLIFFPRFTTYGALIITCTVGLGTVLCVVYALFNPLFPLAMTLLAATLAALTWRDRSARTSPASDVALNTAAGN